MSDNVVVRIIQTDLKNFKNVKNGSIQYMNYGSVQKNAELTHSDIVGIYGQNGSGKTALIESLDLLKHILEEDKIPFDTYAGLMSDQEMTHLATTFFIINGEDKYKAKYEVSLRPNEESRSIELVDEHLTYWTRGATWKAERDIHFSNPYYETDNFLQEETIGVESKHIEYFKDIKFLNSMQILAAVCAQSHTSVIFNEKVRKALKEIPGKEPSVLRSVICCLARFAGGEFHVVKVDQLGDINSNKLIPLNLHQDNGTSIIQGCMPLFTKGQGEVPENMYPVFESTIEAINIAIQAIIPNLQIELEKVNEIRKDDDQTYIQVDVYSRRNGKRFLTRYESEGIKRIISLLGYLIAVYNDPAVCLVIDELDSGIFEYLLGELLGVLQQEMRGQLIFTSHNLRALEKLDYKNIICSTTNPENRYISLTGVGINNNTRDFYIRAIILGGQKETLYNDEDLESIEYAFRKAIRPKPEKSHLTFSDKFLSKLKGSEEQQE